MMSAIIDKLFKAREQELIAEFITRLEMIADEDDLYKTKEYYEKKLQEGE